MYTLYLWILTTKFIYWFFNYLKCNLQHITTFKLCLDMRYTFWRLEKIMKCRSKCFYLFVISVQSLSRVRLFVTPWTAAPKASPSITNSQNLLKLMSIESVVPSNHFILCDPLHLLPSIFPSIRIFSNESALRIRWPKYWNFSFNIIPSNEYSGLISLRMDWFPLGWTDFL